MGVRPELAAALAALTPDQRRHISRANAAGIAAWIDALARQDEGEGVQHAMPLKRATVDRAHVTRENTLPDRRHVLKGLAGAIPALAIIGAADAKGGFCQKARPKSSSKKRCNASLKLCGQDCVPDNAVCCAGAAYTGRCQNGKQFICTGSTGQCCNGGGSQCKPAETAC